MSLMDVIDVSRASRRSTRVVMRGFFDMMMTLRWRGGCKWLDYVLDINKGENTKGGGEGIKDA